MLTFEWHDIKTPIFICLWAIFIVLTKIAFHSSDKLALAFPDSALLIIAGFSVSCDFVPYEIRTFKLTHLASSF